MFNFGMQKTEGAEVAYVYWANVWEVDLYVPVFYKTW